MPWFAPCLFDGGNDESIDESIGFQDVIGYSTKYQNKSRLFKDSHYVVDYDAIFAESGGQLKDYWELPLEIDRNLDNVPSKKRSMYRKRYAMLDDWLNNRRKIRIVKVKSAVNINRTFGFIRPSSKPQNGYCFGW